jgi:hypothetical protein
LQDAQSTPQGASSSIFFVMHYLLFTEACTAAYMQPAADDQNGPQFQLDATWIVLTGYPIISKPVGARRMHLQMGRSGRFNPRNMDCRAADEGCDDDFGCQA